MDKVAATSTDNRLAFILRAIDVISNRMAHVAGRMIAREVHPGLQQVQGDRYDHASTEAVCTSEEEKRPRSRVKTIPF